MKHYVPLAEKLRPTKLEEIVGQDHILGKDAILSLSIQKKKPLSLLLWGPPGCGKTTLAKLYAKVFDTELLSLSAVSSGVADIRKIIHSIESEPLFKRTPFLFIDEIHRYNKSQQDLILPYLEKGTFILIGATTENPSFSLNNALLSRLRVVTLNPLNELALKKILSRYEEKFGKLNLPSESYDLLIHLAQGDGRYLLNMIETIENVDNKNELLPEELLKVLQTKAALYDRDGEGHYNLISALHKSVRGSDPDAALYWFQRMLVGGEDPLFIARRMIRMASEDIGLADPQALVQAIAAREAYLQLGSPEGELALAQALVYMALCPKSNALYVAYNSSRKSAENSNSLSPPKIILNAPTHLMKKMGFGKNYLYDHDLETGFSGQNYFPDGFERENYYFPVDRGFERDMKKRIDYFNKLRNKITSKED